MRDKVILSGVVFRLKRHFANKQVLTLKARSSEKLVATPLKNRKAIIHRKFLSTFVSSDSSLI